MNVESNGVALLPPPDELGDGNPMMMFVCLTLLLEHRDLIMNRHMDFNEMAIFFDKQARKRHAAHILRRARVLYSDYKQSEDMLHVSRS